MTVRASVSLFGKPAWEIDELEGGELTAELIDRIRKRGDEIRQNLEWAADTLTILRKHGWNGSGGLYEIMLYKDATLEEAEQELTLLGIKPEDIALEAEEEEFEEELSDA